MTDNVWHTIKLNPQSELELYKMSAEFTNAVCKFYRLLPIGYILTVYANIPYLLGSVIVEKNFHKILIIQANINSLSYRILRYLLLTSAVQSVHCVYCHNVGY